MIVVEEKLKELFETLPPYEEGGNSFQPTFDLGTEEDINKLLRSDNTAFKMPYPLIWLITPVATVGDKSVRCDLEFIVATQNKVTDLNNLKRLETTFTNVLFPLINNMIIAFDQSGFSRITNRKAITRTNYFNHVQSTDIWDAIRFGCNLEIRNSSIKKIIYQNE